jgi:ABC-type oligopeptide transport system substrate-binding subunit
MDQEQLTLLAERLQTIGVGRREFLKVAGALAGGAVVQSALGPLAPAQAQPMLPPGVKLAKEQVFRWANPSEPSSLDTNRYLYAQGDALLWAWLMKFDPDYKPVPWLAERFEASPQGDVYTFYLRPGLKWSNGDPVTAQDFVWSYQRKLDPATAADYPGFFYDIKNAEKINKGEIKDLTQLGAIAKDDRTLEFQLEGPRGYFHVLMAYAATAPSHKASVEKYGDKWTEPGNIVSNGIFVLESWDHNKQFTLKKNPLYFEKDKIILEKVVRPIIAVQSAQ